MLSFGLHNRRALGKIVGKFSEHKTVTSVLVRCEIAGNSKSFSDEWNIMVFCATLNCLNYSKSKVSTLKVSSKFKAQETMAFKNGKKRISARKELSHLCGSFCRRLLQRKSGNTYVSGF